LIQAFQRGFVRMIWNSAFGRRRNRGKMKRKGKEKGEVERGRRKEPDPLIQIQRQSWMAKSRLEEGGNKKGDA